MSLLYIVPVRSIRYRTVMHQDGCTALHIGCSMGHTSMVSALLSTAGCDVNAQDDSGQASLHYTVESDLPQRDLVELLHLLLLHKGVDINIADKNGQTAMHLAAEQGLKDAAQCLLDNEADADIVDLFSKTPIQIAVEMGHTDIVELIENVL